MTTDYYKQIQELIDRRDELLVPYRDKIMQDYDPSTEIDWSGLKDAISEIYLANDLPAPKFIHVESPWQAATAIVMLQLIKCGDKTWRSQLEDLLAGTLWQKAFDVLKVHIGKKKEPGIAGDDGSTVWLTENVGKSSNNHQGYVLRCDRVMRDKINPSQFATLRSALIKSAEPVHRALEERFRLMRMVRPNRQLMLHLYSLSENTRRQIVREPSAIGRFRSALEQQLEQQQEVASFDRSLREGTLEAELIDLFSDEMIEELPKRLFLSAQNSQLTYQESVEILAAHFAKIFCNCIMGIQWKFPRDEWLAVNTFPLDFLDENFYEEPLIRILKSWPILLKNNVPHIFLNNLCLLIEKPLYTKLDEDGRLHCETDSAIKYKDGFELYSWHGATVPRDVVLAPDTITVASIEVETNTEVRRVMIERFGESRYLEESGAELQSEDRYGQLFRKVLPEEDFVMVRVKNSTAEPDGSYRYYYIRVPPSVTSAHEAVAWTFGLQAGEYNPDIET